MFSKDLIKIIASKYDKNQQKEKRNACDQHM